MANPQPDQYTKISNELMEQVPRFKFNGTQFRIILVIWRYTYGFNRKSKNLSVSYISEATDITIRQIERELGVLIERNVVRVVSESAGRRSRILEFNKDYDSWESVDPTKKTVQEQISFTDELDGSVPTKKTVKRLRSTDELDGEERKVLKKTLKTGIHEEIIHYLNEKTGKKYNHKVKTTKEFINGRLSEGRTLEDFIQVIDVKCTHWLNDPKMVEYLRPDTLFRPTNFDKYLNQTPKVGRDAVIESRDREIAFQRWIEEGNDPDGFDWS